MEPSQEIFTAEIKALEAKLEAKKREMAAAGTEAGERHVFKEVVREHAGIERPIQQYSTVGGTAPRPGTIAGQTVISKQDEEVLDQLVSHAFTKGIRSAIAEARKTNIPFLIDLLHDRLVDEYYDKLLQARKIKPQ